MHKIILLIFAIMLSPCLLALLPDQQHKRSRPIGRQDPTPWADGADDSGENSAFCDFRETPHVLTEKERKAEFDRQQAAFDVDFLIGQIDILYGEYHEITSDLDILSGKIDIAEDMHEVDKLKRYYKDREKLNKSLLSVSAKIHNTEKKLRSAQFKAGMQVTC